MPPILSGPTRSTTLSKRANGSPRECKRGALPPQYVCRAPLTDAITWFSDGVFASADKTIGAKAAAASTKPPPTQIQFTVDVGIGSRWWCCLLCSPSRSDEKLLLYVNVCRGGGRSATRELRCLPARLHYHSSVRCATLTLYHNK